MNKITRQSNELQEKLKQQIELLNLNCTNFDNGNEVAGLNIATTIRVLIYDYGDSSKSLLGQLDLKGIDFLDSSTSMFVLPYMGLIYKLIEGDLIDGQGGSLLYKPLFNEKLRNINIKWLKFENWWEQKIFINSNQDSLSRKDLVLKIVNQEGGAHVDPKIDQVFDKFRHSYSGDMIIIGRISGKFRDFENIPILPAVRQIAYELIETFKKCEIINEKT